MAKTKALISGNRLNGSRENYTEKQISEALIKCKGFVNRAAIELGCSERTVYGYIDRYPELREVRQFARRKRVELAEELLDGLMEKAKDERVQLDAIKFTLSRQGKDMGWSQRTEVTGADGKPLHPITRIEINHSPDIEEAEILELYEKNGGKEAV